MSLAATDFSLANLPTVVLSFMNQVHAEELALVQNLVVHLHAQAEDEKISHYLTQWLEHSKNHFAREEFLMEQYNFFAYPMHQAEHQQALQDLAAVKQDWEQQQNREILGNFIQVWRAWLQQHINSMDFVTAQFLRQYPIPQDPAQIDQQRNS